MSKFIRNHIVTIANSFFFDLCCYDSILDAMLKVPHSHGISKESLLKEKNDILDFYERLDASARMFFGEDMQDLKAYFGYPDNDKENSPLLCFVLSRANMWTYDICNKLGQSYCTIEKNLLSMSDEDYYTGCGSVFLDYRNKIVQEELILEDSANLSSLLNAIINSDLSDNLKCSIQNIILNREEHQKKYLQLLQKGISFLLVFESELEKIVKDFFNYWKPIINNDYKAFIEEYIPLFKDYSDNPYGYELTPSLFANNISLSGDFDLDKKIYNEPFELNIGVLYGKTMTPKLTLGGSESVSSETGCINALKLISDKTRFDILTYLKDKEAYGGEIAKHLGISPATISHHMASMCDAGLISINARSSKIYYSINSSNVKKIIELMKSSLL